MGPYPRYNYHTDLKLRKSLEFIRKGGSYPEAQRICGISPCTLKKYYKMFVAEFGIAEKSETRIEFPPAKLSRDPFGVLTPEHENILKENLQKFSKLFYGLSEKECRSLAYQMAVINDLKMPVDWQHGLAGQQWLMNYKLRHTDLNIEKPNGCSVRKNRSVVHEKINVSTFYDNLEKLFQSSTKLQNNTRIFSLDEIYTNPYPGIKKDKESKGDIVTTCCFINASGTYLPPVIVQPHKTSMNTTISPDALTLTASQGRLTMDMFHKVMQHFINHSSSSPDNPSILIMDIDGCHLSIDAISIAETYDVHLLIYHPHTSKILQPLELGLTDLFQKHYYESLNNAQFVETAIITLTDVTKIVCEALQKAMMPEYIQNAFKKCGIVPFDRDLLTDNDYSLCMVVETHCLECKSRDYRAKDRGLLNAFDSEDTLDKNLSEVSNDGQVKTSGNTAGCQDSIRSQQNNDFPADEKRKSDWTKIIQRARLDEFWKPSNRSVICSIHFKEQYFYDTKGGLKRLNKTAIPTERLALTPEFPELHIETSKPSTSDNVTQLQSPARSNSEIGDVDISDLESVFDTPRKVKLKYQLQRKQMLCERHIRQMKILKQKYRRLAKKYENLKNILKNLKNNSFINNDVNDLL